MSTHSLTINKDSIERYKNFVRLRKNGATFKEIGTMYGITRQAVQNRIKKGFPKQVGGPKGILAINDFLGLKGRERARMLVRIRDNFTCRVCGKKVHSKDIEETNQRIRKLKGKKKSLDVHHTDGNCGKNSRGYDSTRDLSKMITVCHKCHYSLADHSRIKKI